MEENNKLKKNNTEIYQKLINVLQSEDTATEIARICYENEITEEGRVREISYQTGRVLAGDLPPNEFRKILEEKIGITLFLATKISREINGSIFHPVKENLASLYGNEVISPEEPTISFPKITEEKYERTKSEEKDNYREPIEQ
jgi:vacuolar-type H+-ATPase subunit I/STV1